jgi:hypothetical protein
MWLDRRRFRMLTGKPTRAKGARPKRHPIAQIRARRSVRKAAALPKHPKASPLKRFQARRAVRASQPRWATHPPKPKIPLKTRLSSALYRPKKLKVERPALRVRLAARASMRQGGPKSPPRAPVFRGRTDKVIAGVVAGSLCFVVLTWLVSRAPVPTEQAQPSLVLAPQAPDDNADLDEFTLPPPPKSETATPKPPATTTAPPVFIPTTTVAPPTTTINPPTTTPPTTTTPPVTTTPPTTTTPPVTTTPPTTTTPPETTTPAEESTRVAGAGTNPTQTAGATLLLLLVAAALARLRSHHA